MSRREYSNSEAVTRGKRVEALLADEMFLSALDEVRDTFVEEWKRGRDVQTRETAWAKFHAVDEFVRVMRSIMDNGKLAAVRLTREPR